MKICCSDCPFSRFSITTHQIILRIYFSPLYWILYVYVTVNTLCVHSLHTSGKTQIIITCPGKQQQHLCRVSSSVAHSRLQVRERNIYGDFSIFFYFISLFFRLVFYFLLNEWRILNGRPLLFVCLFHEFASMNFIQPMLFFFYYYFFM